MNTPATLNDTPILPQDVKAAMQDLLKNGWLEAAQKPNLYALLHSWTDAINAALAPLDFILRLDDVRGLAYLTVSEACQDADGEWAHPLVRRQRLTLEQSLLVAILRQYYIDKEQQLGIGTDQAWVDCDDIQTQLAIYLSASGSEQQDEKRLHGLLEALRKQGIVSEVNDCGQVRIRPLIAHLANPQALSRLLRQYQDMAVKDE